MLTEVELRELGKLTSIDSIFSSKARMNRRSDACSYHRVQPWLR